MEADIGKASAEGLSSPVSEFYTGKSVFITGATGFVGKVLCEKLLRSCPGIDKLYVLLRCKRGKSIRERLQTLLNSEAFVVLKKEDPYALGKVRPIEGDISLPKLGISESDLEELQQNVSVIFHAAATVKFNEPLRVAVSMNLIGTMYVLELAKKLNVLDAFVHVSTAYSNCDREEIEERIYPAGVTTQFILDTYHMENQEILNALGPLLLKGRPNTYTLTKALAENYLAENAGDMKIAIVRPSIVTASWKEPQTGWVDSLGGVTGIFFTISNGILRNALMNSNAEADFVPVDVLTNLLVTVAWHTATNDGQSTRVTESSIPIYNCTASNAIKWSKVQNIAVSYIQENPSLTAFRCPKLKTTTNRLGHMIAVFGQHYVPAFFIDALRMLVGKKPRMIRIYNNFHPILWSQNFFSLRGWKFSHENAAALYQEMTLKDQKCFDFNMDLLDWTQYLQNHVMGVRHFILKEDDSKLHVAKKRMRNLYIRSVILKWSSMIAFALILFRKSSTARSILRGLISIFRQIILR